MIIKGIPITLYTKTLTGTDEFNRETYTETATIVDNVVIGQPSSADILNEYNLSGKTISYTLAIPADDDHDWENATVEFYGRKWRTIGIPREYMAGFMGAKFPWNKQINVESFNGSDTIQTESSGS